MASMVPTGQPKPIPVMQMHTPVRNYFLDSVKLGDKNAFLTSVDWLEIDAGDLLLAIDSNDVRNLTIMSVNKLLKAKVVNSMVNLLIFKCGLDTIPPEIIFSSRRVRIFFLNFRTQINMQKLKKKSFSASYTYSKLDQRVL